MMKCLMFFWRNSFTLHQQDIIYEQTCQSQIASVLISFHPLLLELQSSRDGRSQNMPNGNMLCL